LSGWGNLVTAWPSHIPCHVVFAIQSNTSTELVAIWLIAVMSLNSNSRRFCIAGGQPPLRPRGTEVPGYSRSHALFVNRSARRPIGSSRHGGQLRELVPATRAPTSCWTSAARARPASRRARPHRVQSGTPLHSDRIERAQAAARGRRLVRRTRRTPHDASVHGGRTPDIRSRPIPATRTRAPGRHGRGSR
jgi:hypothetical protein